MIVATYYLNSIYGKKLLRRIEEKEPQYGDTIIINGQNYFIINSKYDYEIWQGTGDYWFTVLLRKCD